MEGKLRVINMELQLWKSLKRVEHRFCSDASANNCRSISGWMGLGWKVTASK